MFRKYASAEIIDHSGRHTGRTAGKRTLGSFDYEPRDDHKYLYVAVRACTADVPNLNYDMLPSSELKGKEAYKSFIGSYVYLNHDNTDPTKARGAIIDAKYHDEDPNDQWVEILEELDEEKCPKLCSLIRSGEIDTVSMGCEVSSTTCSICGNEAEYPFEYCNHIASKGQEFGGKLAYEICNGIDFFECSWVYNPADPTAYVQALDKTASRKQSYIDWAFDGIIKLRGNSSHMLQGNFIMPYRNPDDSWKPSQREYGIESMVTFIYLPVNDTWRWVKDDGLGSESSDYFTSLEDAQRDFLDCYDIGKWYSFDKTAKIAAVEKDAFPSERLDDVVRELLPEFAQYVESGNRDALAASSCAAKAMKEYGLSNDQMESVRRGLISVYYDVTRLARKKGSMSKTAVQTTFVPHWDMDYSVVEYTVYQCDDLENCDWVFFDYDFAMKHGFDFSKYDRVYEGKHRVPHDGSYENMTDQRFCDVLFMEWNDNQKPRDAAGYMRSLSMSDIVELYGKYYYCDTFGWKLIDPFVKGEKTASKHADGGEKEDSFANSPRKPDDIATKEEQSACPLCDSPTFDGEYCDICGYQVPPEGFDDIKLEDDSDYEEFESESDDTSESEDEDFSFGYEDDESEDIDESDSDDEDDDEHDKQKTASVMYDISDDPQVYIGIAEQYGDYDLIGFDIIKTDDFDLQCELEDAGAIEM